MAVLIIEKSQKAVLIGQQHELLENGTALQIGRDASNDVALEDQRSSRNHCRVYLQDGNWYLEDGGSRNGTLLRGEKIKKIALSGDTRFQVGSSLMHFRPNEHVDRFQGKEVHGCRLEKLLSCPGGVMRYHAWQLALDRGIRLDILHPGWPCLAKPSAHLEERLRQLDQDLTEATRLNHPNVAPVLRSSIPDDRGGGQILIKLSGMTSLGDSLSQLLAAGQPVSLKFLSMLADALCTRAKHASLNTPFGLDDIGFDSRGCPWIPALELSSWIAIARGQGRTLPGLVPYLPPEMVARLDSTDPPPAFTFASMAYNFGAIAYHLLTGKPPMGDGLGAEILRNHLKLAVAPANLLAPTVPDEIVALLDRLLKKQPRERPSSPEEIVGPFENSAATLQDASEAASPADASSPATPEPAPVAVLDDLDDDEDDDDWDVLPENTPAPNVDVAPANEVRPASAVAPSTRSALVDARSIPLWVAFWVLLFFMAKYGVRLLLESNLSH